MNASGHAASAPRAKTYARPLQGIALILVTAMMFSSLDSTARGISHAGSRWAVPVLLILTVRFTVQAAVMGVVLAPRGRTAFATAYPGFQLLRGVLLLLTSLLSFYAVSLMPVPEFTAINMLTPLLVTMLASVVLHEPVSLLRWSLVAGGFAGALIVTQPGSGVFGWVVLLPLLGAFSYASFQVLTSRMAGAESPLTTHFYTGLVGAAVLWLLLAIAASHQEAGAVQALLHRLPAGAWVAMLVIGLLGTGGHLLLILALGKAPTSTLMPFLYAQIGFSTLIGYVFFDHMPDQLAWVGMAVIAVCGASAAGLNIGRSGASTAATTAGDVAPQ